MATGLKSINIDPKLHQELKAESDKLGMKFRLYIQHLLLTARKGKK